jgi:hypothetical protein
MPLGWFWHLGRVFRASSSGPLLKQDLELVAKLSKAAFSSICRESEEAPRSCGETEAKPETKAAGSVVQETKTETKEENEIK